MKATALKKPLILVALALVMGIAGFFAVLTLNGDSIRTYVNAECEVDVCVALKGDRAEPDAIVVKVGGSVQFNSADGKKHAIGIGHGGENHEHTDTSFYSGVFGAKEGYRATFSKAGTYELHDHQNPSIHATVVVYEPGADHTIK